MHHSAQPLGIFLQFHNRPYLLLVSMSVVHIVDVLGQKYRLLREAIARLGREG